MLYRVARILMLSLLPCTLLYSKQHAATEDPLVPSKFIIKGPGINRPQVVYPVRYFFVQLVHQSGRSATQSAGRNYLRLSISGDGLYRSDGRRGRCHAAISSIDRNDGSYILRYKLISSCQNLEITILTEPGKEHVGKSPYKFTSGTMAGRPFVMEHCNCPISLTDWYKELGCPNTYSTIEHDFKRWPRNSVNFTKALEEAYARYGIHPGGYSYCHYVIEDNEIHRKCFGEHIGFNMFSDAMMTSILRKVQLPDMEFLINLGDWPLETARKEFVIPMISWCGSDDTKDIILPTYELMEATLEMMGRQSMDVLSVQGMTGPKWKDKLDRAFFKGRDSREERLLAVKLSREYPEHLEANITRFFFFRDKMDEYGPETDNTPLNEFFQYKYQVNIDGTVAAYRLPYLLLSDSVVLKQDSPYYEHFYHDLKPWVHYIPVKRDLSDLISMILWAKSNEKKVLSIIRKAQEYARKALQPKHIFCYHVKVFERYSTILDRSIAKDKYDEMAHVPQASNEELGCKCRVPKGQEVRVEL